MKSEDTISRQAAMDAISRIGLCKCSTNEVQAVDECLRAVENLPPVNTEKTGHWTRWIPVSERLPENGTYLVTIKGMVDEPRIDMKSFAKDLNKVDDFDFPNHKCGWYDYDSEYGYWEDTMVTAWMPQPQPYKA